MSTNVVCNATDCMDNEDGKCILGEIKVYLIDGKVTCSEYDPKYAVINKVTKIRDVEITDV